MKDDDFDFDQLDLDLDLDDEFPPPSNAALYILIALILMVTAVALFLSVRPILAHDAIPTAAQPSGWKYPFTCCSGIDCREVNTDASAIKISTRPEGYVISSTGEVINYQDKRIKFSPDGQYHWCSVAGSDDSRTICLFVPPGSS